MTGHPVAESFATARAANIMRRHIRHELRALKPTRPRSFPRRNPRPAAAERAGCETITRCAGCGREHEGTRYTALHEDGRRRCWECSAAAHTRRPF